MTSTTRLNIHSIDSSSSKRVRNCLRYTTKDVQRTKSNDLRRSRLTGQAHKSVRSVHSTEIREQMYVVVTIGAAMEFSKRKVYPALWNLYKKGQLPNNLRFYAFARSPMTREELKGKCQYYMQVEPSEEKKYEEFWNTNTPHVGNYLTRVDYDVLHRDLTNAESSNVTTNRMYFLIIPNTFIESVAQSLRTLTQTKRGWTRVIIEKPFGRDIAASFKITQQLLSLCLEEDLYRIDSYLCKSVVQSILTIRFCNYLFASTWNRKMIENVTIELKDTAPTQTKGRYTDSYGIICDSVQLHGLQILALIAMEKPISMKPDEVRDEKVKLLKCISPVTLSNVVLGQYVGYYAPEAVDSRTSGFDDTDTNGLKAGSLTYCTTAFQINNERWDGVPFILTCGKGLDERKSVIRIRYQNVPADIFNTNFNQNELVIQIEPQEKTYIRAMTKIDNLTDEIKELPLFDGNGFVNDESPDSYDNMLLNVITGVQTHFIRTGEMKQAWRIYTPLLNTIETGEAEIFKYNFGSAGPPETERFIKRFVTNEEIPRSVTR